MFSVKIPHDTPLRFITSSITKQNSLTLDHWACPLKNSRKDSGGFKKKTVKKKTKWNYKKTLWPFFMDGVQLLQD